MAECRLLSRMKHFGVRKRLWHNSLGGGVLAISKHLKNIFAEGELDTDTTISKMETVVNRGIRGEVKELIDFYSLDAIIAVGYRVSSLKATRFRQWATKIQ